MIDGSIDRGPSVEAPVSATELRVHLGEILRRVDAERVVTVERGGRPLAVLMSLAEYQRLLGAGPTAADLALDRARALRQRVATRGGLVAAPEDVLADLREERADDAPRLR